MKVRSIGARLLAVIAICMIGLLVTSSIAAYLLYQQMINDKWDKTRAMAEIARNLAKSLDERSKAGEFDQKTAQEMAKTTLRALRYDGGNYFYIYDPTGTVLMHGTFPARENKNFIDEKDAVGNDYIKDIIRVGTQGGGRVEFYFPKAPGGKPLPKLTALSYYEPWGWVFGTGAYVDDVVAEFWQVVLALGGLSGVVLVIAGTAGLVLARSISRPIRSLSGVTHSIAKGNYAIDIPAADQADEIGVLATAIKELRDEARHANDLRTAQAEQERKATGERKQAVLDLADGFEASVMGVVRSVAASGTEMRMTAESMSASAQEATTQATSGANAAEIATANVQTVAAAAEQLSASIAEISRQVNDAARISTSASNEVAQTNDMVQSLSVAANRIGEVVQLINDIASQTNLLALNATIEAARAGDAGKGFAVVAGEVKTLASQTGRATEEITSQIASVQEETRRVVTAIRNIGTVIEQVHSISSGIAAAVEEQGAATQEIARNVQRAAQGTRQVSDTISQVANAVTATGSAAEMVLASAGALATNSDRLRTEVGGFLSNIRA